MTVVLVKSRAVDGPAQSTSNQGVLDADPVDEDRRQDTEQAHQSKNQRVSSIDLHQISHCPKKNSNISIPDMAQEHHPRPVNYSHSGERKGKY